MNGRRESMSLGRLVLDHQCSEVAPGVQMCICTKFKPEGRTVPTDVRQYPRYPMALPMKLVLAKAAMMLHR
jgi:hypothetical protein